MPLALCSQTTSAAELMDRWGTSTTTSAFSCEMPNCAESIFGGGPLGNTNTYPYHETLSSSQVTDGKFVMLEQ